MANLTETLTIRVDAELVAELEQRAAEVQRTPSDLARVLIRDGLLRFADAAPFAPIMHPEAIDDGA